MQGSAWERRLFRGGAGVYCGRARAKMEILAKFVVFRRGEGVPCSSRYRRKFRLGTSRGSRGATSKENSVYKAGHWDEFEGLPNGGSPGRGCSKA